MASILDIPKQKSVKGLVKIINALSNELSVFQAEPNKMFMVLLSKDSRYHILISVDVGNSHSSQIHVTDRVLDHTFRNEHRVVNTGLSEFQTLLMKLKYHDNLCDVVI